MSVIRLISARLARQEGQAMAITMLVMVVTMGVAYAAFGATGGDAQMSKRDTDSKRAYSAAQAGLADYLQKLETDNEYWLKCTNVPVPDSTQPTLKAPVNQLWSGTGTDPRVWRAVAGDTAAQYAIELVPAAPATACVENQDASMLTKDGTLRIKTTGKVGPAGSEVKRSIITTLRRRGFLDFIYFTDLETGDPTQLVLGAGGAQFKRCAGVAQAAANPTGAQPNCPDDTLAAWAAQDATCRQYRKLSGLGRDAVRYTGYEYFDPAGSRGLGWWTVAEAPDVLRCSSIQFIDGDAIRGPFHSNDTILVCGAPDFGRNRSGNTGAPVDRIEHWGVVQACAGAAPDYGNNTPVVGDGAGILELPESNTQLKATAQSAGYVFTGKTTIVLSSGGMTVNGVSKAYPTNGLVYVQNATSPSCGLTDVTRPYASEPQCGDVYLSGDYGANLTIAADRDIVVSGDVKRVSGSNNLLGLIANNFVRIEHHMANDNAACGGQANVGTQTQNRTVEAAILSLGHVLTVDNYQCGASLGNLTVRGAIGQKYRGPVGTSGPTGYVKDYYYDDRLKYRSPPYFISPVQSAWRVLRSTEQSPAL